MTIQGYYPLSKNAKDYSGSGNDGTAVGYTANDGTDTDVTYTDNPSGIGKVASFNGSTSAFTVASAVVPNAGVTTVQVRFKCSMNPATMIYFMDFAAGSYGQFALAWDTTNKPLFYLRSDWYAYFASLAAYIDGEEHVLTLIVNPGSITDCKLYVDGTSIARSSTSTGSDSVTLDQFKIGTAYIGDSSKIRIWNHELTLPEIVIEEASLYPVKGEGLTGSWTLNGNSNDTNNIIKGQGSTAHRFDGVGTKISSSITTSGSAGTVMGWVYRTSSTTQGIVYDTSYHPLLYFSSGKLQAHYSGASFNGGSSYSGQYTPSIDAWHHVGFTWVSGGAYALYSDGVAVDSGTITGTANGSGTVDLGYYSTNFLSGGMYDTKILDYAETAQEMARITSLGVGTISVTDDGNLQATEMNETGHKPLNMDYTVWEDGQTGSVGSWSTTGSGNTRVLAEDPWGKETVVWKTSDGTDPTYPVTGGIYHATQAIDPTKTYRMVTWERRVDNNGATSGRYYFGLNAYGTVNGVYRISGGAANTNPYFSWKAHDATPNLQGEWYMVVGYIHPHDYVGTANHTDTGFWNIDGEKIATVNYGDYKWDSTTTTARLRTLTVYHGNTAGMVHHSAYYRLDEIDGTEPSLNALLAGHDSRNIDLVRDKGGANEIAFTPMKDQATTNKFIETPFAENTNLLYNFNGNDKDYSGNGNDATLNTASLTTDRFGTADNAYEISSGDEINTGIGAGLNPSTTSYTLGGWFNVTVSSTNQVIFMFGDNTGSNQRAYFGTSGGYYSMGIYDSAYGTGSTILTDTNKHLLIAVFDSSTNTAYYYVDGQLAETKGYSSYTVVDNIQIGNYDATSHDLTGNCDSFFTMEGVALSQAEAQLMFESTSREKQMKVSNDGTYISNEIKEVI